ncbi:MAG: haloalkane dehalogenase [Pseudomonadota bacterium]
MTAAFPYEKKFKTINGARIAYVEEGEGDPIVFLHGNPTSSYLWRNIMPHLAGMGRLIAPDLIGMGDSDKLPDSGPDRYTYTEHRDYLFALLDALDVKSNVTLVIHDWGSVLGFNWAREHEAAMKGIAFMEAIAVPVPTWDLFPEMATEIFQGFRSDAGEEMILQNNMFIEQVLPMTILRTLEPAEMDAYRKPFLTPGEDRRPTLTWPRQLPIAGTPANVIEIVEANGAWLAQTPIPKFLANAEPGALIVGPALDVVRSWPNLTEITVPGVHFIQEDAPDEIGQGIASWLKSLT